MEFANLITSLKRNQRTSVDDDVARTTNEEVERALLYLRGCADFEINFIGLWDMVPAYGNPYNRADEPLRLSTPAGAHLVHALSLDEPRSAFKADRPNSARDVWFAGRHADIGGGGNPGLSDITLGWMIHQAQQAGVPVRMPQLAGDPLARMSAPFPDPSDIGLRLPGRVNAGLRTPGAGDNIHITVFERMDKIRNYGIEKSRNANISNATPVRDPWK